jgi:CRISPR/Cas system-associated endoribonuclease Cas2
MKKDEQDLNNEIQRREALRSTFASPEREQLRECLIDLMVKIIAWGDYPALRRQNWIYQIELKRSEIRKLQLKHDDLNDEYLEYIWTVCFERARQLARAEFGTSEGQFIFPLTFQQVFDDYYSLSWFENIRARFLLNSNSIEN